MGKRGGGDVALFEGMMTRKEKTSASAENKVITSKFWEQMVGNVYFDPLVHKNQHPFAYWRERAKS